MEEEQLNAKQCQKPNAYIHELRLLLAVTYRFCAYLPTAFHQPKKLIQSLA